MVLLMIDHATKDWKQITEDEKKLLPEEEQQKVLYMDSLLKARLDHGIEQQKKNNDVVGIIAGAEGSGKSTMAGNIMRYVSKDTWNPQTDMIGSDYEEGIDIIQKAKHGSAIMFDEGNVFFLSTEIMKREARDLHKVFSIFRQKCLFVLIVLPSFFRLNSYFALDRSRFLIQTYLVNGERSSFAYWGDKQKAKLYSFGKKTHDYKVVRPTFRGKYGVCYPLETPEYKKFKLSTLSIALSSAKKTKVKSPSEIKREVIQQIIEDNPDKSSIELAKILPINDSRVRQVRLELKKKDINNH